MIINHYLVKACGLFTLIGLSIANLNAHQVIKNKNADIVPIPQFSESDVVANGYQSWLAANQLLKAFSKEKQDQLLYNFDDKSRLSWSNLPAKMVQRAGLNIGQMTEEQRQFLFKFLSVSLGREGYETITETLAAEAFLEQDEKADFFQWSPENFWISFYGKPTEKGQWAWQFGGHHLAINMTLNHGRVTSMSPSFIGTEPAKFHFKGVDYSAVVDMHNAGYAAFMSLTPAQKAQASINSSPNDVITGPGKDGLVPPKVGIKVSELNQEQQALVLAAANEWVSIQVKENASQRMLKISQELGETYFAWYGENDYRKDSYFRIQGPSIVAELLSGLGNVGTSANNKGHYHTIYRNPLFDYGKNKRQAK